MNIRTLTLYPDTNHKSPKQWSRKGSPNVASLPQGWSARFAMTNLGSGPLVEHIASVRRRRDHGKSPAWPLNIATGLPQHRHPALPIPSGKPCANSSSTANRPRSKSASAAPPRARRRAPPPRVRLPGVQRAVLPQSDSRWVQAPSNRARLQWCQQSNARPPGLKGMAVLRRRHQGLRSNLRRAPLLHLHLPLRPRRAPPSWILAHARREALVRSPRAAHPLGFQRARAPSCERPRARPGARPGSYESLGSARPSSRTKGSAPRSSWKASPRAS